MNAGSPSLAHYFNIGGAEAAPPRPAAPKAPAAATLTVAPAGPPSPEATVGLSELPGLLREWLRLQDETAALNTALRERKVAMKAVRSAILRDMEGHDLGTVNVTRGTVVHSAREAKQPMSRKFLQEKLAAFFGGDEAKAAQLLTFLDDKRETTVKHELRLHRANGADVAAAAAAALGGGQ
jgi:hypothetical protein